MAGCAIHQTFEEHPLDFDWRFSRETRDFLAHELGAFARPLLLGTPTIAESLCQASRPYQLVDRQPRHPSFSRPHVVADLCEPELPVITGSFDVVLADPPWYPEHVQRWINKALAITNRRVPIWIAVWAHDTRPGAREEHAALLGALRTLGEVEVARRTVAYDTPPFEAASWDATAARTGTLIRFRPATSAASNLSEDAIIRVAQWQRFNFGARQVAMRLKPDIKETGPPALESVYLAGDWFQRSVSRRHHTRPSIDLWASNGFVARLRNHEAFLLALEALASGDASNLNNAAALARDALLRTGVAASAESGGKVWTHHEWMPSI